MLSRAKHLAPPRGARPFAEFILRNEGLRVTGALGEGRHNLLGELFHLLELLL